MSNPFPSAAGCCALLLTGVLAGCGSAAVHNDPSKPALSSKLTRQNVSPMSAKRGQGDCKSAAAPPPLVSPACRAQDPRAPVHLFLQGVHGPLASKRIFNEPSAKRAAAIRKILTRMSQTCSGTRVLQSGASVQIVWKQPCGQDHVSGKVGVDLSQHGWIGVDLDLNIRNTDLGQIHGHFRVAPTEHNLCASGSLTSGGATGSGRRSSAAACRTRAVTLQRLLLAPLMPALLFTHEYEHGLCP